jgi:ABC-type transporter Mla maintaining outer membrane lipid asymmetry permease subunit MlaE
MSAEFWSKSNTFLRQMPGADILAWFSPVGCSFRLFCAALSPAAFRSISWRELRTQLIWMGEKSFHLIALAAVFIGIALTIQCVNELQNYQAEDLSGAVISIGLLRKLGPLTVSLAWCARVAARVSEEALNFGESTDNEFATRFVLPRYLAALMIAVPLGGYGLVIGFLTAALAAPLLGVGSTADFLQSAKDGIHTKDLVVYFLKLIFVNPTIAIFAACAAARASKVTSVAVAANAVTATFICGYIANLAVTIAAFLYSK